ncbi:REP-associated tyrosine transposase [Ferrimonas gelatinilytica]|uniref:Transposase n=1 Tax=Ferrimonas gelatinilytica TaxID=1255257 RepID=A0ABP9RUT7_9GAMM
MRYRRAFSPGGTFFFTLVLQDRNRTLLTERIQQLRASFARVQTAHPFFIEAIVILPDHLHCIWSLPEGDSNYSQRWNLIKGDFSRQVAQTEAINTSRKSRRERGIWQRRFWEHQIRNPDDHQAHCDYIHFNPVKHGYVARPVDWPYSSIHREIQRGTLDTDWCTSSP